MCERITRGLLGTSFGRTNERTNERTNGEVHMSCILVVLDVDILNQCPRLTSAKLSTFRIVATMLTGPRCVEHGTLLWIVGLLMLFQSKCKSESQIDLAVFTFAVRNFCNTRSCNLLFERSKEVNKCTFTQNVMEHRGMIVQAYLGDIASKLHEFIIITIIVLGTSITNHSYMNATQRTTVSYKTCVTVKYRVPR